MLNKNKIIAMTNLAIYEKHKGRDALEAASYYREDYISNRILRGIIRYTAVYILFFFLYLLMQGEELVFKMSFQLLVSLGRRAIILYLFGLTVTVALFLFFSYFSYEKAVEERDKYDVDYLIIFDEAEDEITKAVNKVEELIEKGYRVQLAEKSEEEMTKRIRAKEVLELRRMI